MVLQKDLRTHRLAHRINGSPLRIPGMKVVMFKGEKSEAKGIIPENTPTGCVKAGELGVTNMSRHHVGLIGVRLEDNDEFGPTGEPFNATNIIGRITKGLKMLKNLKKETRSMLEKKSQDESTRM